MSVFDYYVLLNLPYDATEQMIKQAYEDKMPQARNNLMAEKYKTAYYVLIDPKRRHEYDLSLGIRKYKKVSIGKKVLKSIARVILTLLDALFSLYLCFVMVVYVCGLGYIVVENGYIDWNLLAQYTHKWSLEIYLLGMFILVDIVLHYYIRRLNRYLKHYKWEVNAYKKEGDSGG